MRTTSTVVLCCLLAAIAPTAEAQPAAADAQPADLRLQQLEQEEIDRGERWALYGVLGPIAAATAVAIATNPSENDVPTPVLATIGGLWALGGAWGTSLGYYRIGSPGYATLSGLGKSVALAGGILLDRWMINRDQPPDGEGGNGMPFLSLLAIGGVVAWDLFDYWDIDDTVRERSARRADRRGPSVAPVLTATSTLKTLGLAGRF